MAGLERCPGLQHGVLHEALGLRRRRNTWGLQRVLELPCCGC